MYLKVRQAKTKLYYAKDVGLSGIIIIETPAAIAASDEQAHPQFPPFSSLTV